MAKMIIKMFKAIQSSSKQKWIIRSSKLRERSLFHDVTIGLYLKSADSSILLIISEEFYGLCFMHDSFMFICFPSHITSLIILMWPTICCTSHAYH